MSVSTVSVPTYAQIKAYFAFTGSPLAGRTVKAEQVLDFLYANPATTRALAAQVGQPMGKRGILNPESVEAVLATIVEANA